MNLGPVEIGLIVLAVMLLFGYKKLPDASRSLGRSLRIFKGEMHDMQDDTTRAPASATTPVRGGAAPPVDRDEAMSPRHAVPDAARPSPHMETR